MEETKGAHLSGGDALNRLYQLGIWRAILLRLFSFRQCMRLRKRRWR